MWRYITRMRPVGVVPFVAAALVLSLAVLYLGWGLSQMSGPTRVRRSLVSHRPKESAEAAGDAPDAAPSPAKADIGSFETDEEKLTLVHRLPSGTCYDSLDESLPDLSSLRGGSGGTGNAFLDTEIFGYPFNIELVFGNRKLREIIYWYGPLEVGDESPEVFRVLREYVDSRYGAADGELDIDAKPRRVDGARWTTDDMVVLLEHTSSGGINTVGLSFRPR